MPGLCAPSITTSTPRAAAARTICATGKRSAVGDDLHDLLGAGHRQRQRDLANHHAAAAGDQLERVPDRGVPVVEVEQLVTRSQRDRGEHRVDAGGRVDDEARGLRRRADKRRAVLGRSTDRWHPGAPDRCDRVALEQLERYGTEGPVVEEGQALVQPPKMRSRAPAKPSCLAGRGNCRWTGEIRHESEHNCLDSRIAGPPHRSWLATEAL
jgi:hypothetical protein